MQTDFLIIGQGISGTFLSKYLIEAGKHVAVVDDGITSSSRIASGVINPVTGRRIVRTWMIEKLIAFAKPAYHEWGEMIGRPIIKETGLIDFHPSVQMQQSFLQRQLEENEFLHEEKDTDEWKRLFNFHYGAGRIAPCFIVDLNTMLNFWRGVLRQKDLLIEETFQWRDCNFKDGKVRWRHVEAEKIVFCNGASHFADSPFDRLPFANNKGEAIIAEIPGLPRGHIYKQSLSIVPWEEDLFWIGSSYEWNYQDALPNPAFKERVQTQLKNWLKLPFRIVDHLAAERPATVERRPFAGLHPRYPNIAILNGMGTKGCSLAPFFARQLADHLTSNSPIDPMADVKRFSKVLSSNS